MTLGQFVWHDLMSTDVDQAKAFYTTLLGWTVRQGFPFPIFASTDHAVGGLVPLDASYGWPSHWMPYVHVANTDAHCARALELGATVGVPPTDIPLGRFAVVSDPTGGSYSPLAPSRPLPIPGAIGTVVSHHLLTSDVPAALAYYTAALDWHAHGPLGDLVAVARHEHDIGLLVRKPEHVPRSYWLPFIRVANVEAVADRAVALGGKVVRTPADIPPIGRFAVLGDPTGGSFAVVVPASG